MKRHKSITEYDSSTLPALEAFSHPEQLVAAFFHASSIGLAVCDNQLRFQVVNQTLAAMNGVPAEAHLGRAVRDILGQAAADVVERILKRVFTTGRPAINVEISVKLPTRGEVGHWIENYFPIRDSTGRVAQVGCIVVDVTQQKRLEKSHRTLTRKLLRAQDEEQRRFARDLHDSINQYHAALKMNLLKLRRNGLDQAARGELLAQSIELLDHCMAETRTISHLLHPPLLDEMGFASATRWYVKGFAQRSGIKVNLNLPPGLDRLPGPIETALFRILQEALTNVHRHAHASRVKIDVARLNGETVLQVQDDGQGIPAEILQQMRESTGGAGVGLASMNERVRELCGVFEVESDHGTTVRVRVPIAEIARDDSEEALSALVSA
ncbi:MAG TPA: PAS domain-containing protein [Terriglobales bacterium]|nr:PAS domain-containing protein [Terriglobales bacterium]